MTTLPMFPLGSILFPGMPLTLRIFEERYLTLLGDLMTSENPEFGVVGIARGLEVGGGEGRLPLGTVASVSEIGTTGEFLGLESVGTLRFRVNEWLPDDPYPIADIELVPEFEWDDSYELAREDLESRVRRLLAFASEFGDIPFGADVGLSEDPVKACWQLAGVLPLGEHDRFDLLDSHSLDELITKTRSIVMSADETLRTMLGSDDGQPKEPGDSS